MGSPPTELDVYALAREALGVLEPAEIHELLRARWTPQLFDAFRSVIRGLVDAYPEETRMFHVVSASRRILRARAETLHRLALDPDLGRWTESVSQVLAGDAPSSRLPGLLALLPRFVVSTAIHEGSDADLTLLTGAGGRARVPADGRVLQGPPARPLRVVVEGGQLINHTKEPRRAGPFELVDGDGSGGAIPAVEPLSGGAVFRPFQVLGKAVDLMTSESPALLAEAGALAPVLAAVRTATEDVSHSAGLRDARLQTWLSFPPNELVVAETIVHEASHHLFFLVEDAVPLVLDPDEARFDVPWRSDLRPLRAVLMGYHAWVRILGFLRAVGGAKWSQRARERQEIIAAALKQARPILEAATGYTAIGRELFCAIADHHERWS